MDKEKKQVDSLVLPYGQFVIAGSKILEVLKIRKSNDVDIVVKKELWDALCIEYRDFVKENPLRIEIGDIEIFKRRVYMEGRRNELIETAIEIDGVPYVNLELFIEWKQKMGREKDIQDIKLLKQRMKKQSIGSYVVKYFRKLLRKS